MDQVPVIRMNAFVNQYLHFICIPDSCVMKIVVTL